MPMVQTFYCSDFRLLNKTLHFILIFDVAIHIWLIITSLGLGQAKISKHRLASA